MKYPVTKNGLISGLTVIVLSGMLIVSCSQKAEEEEATEEEQQAQVLANGNSTTTESAATVPQVGSINLDNLGDDGSAAALRLTESADKCSDGPDLGIFGLALSGACGTSGFASKIMLGSEDGDTNGDGALNCSDYVEGKDSGIMLGLMCGDFFKRFDGIKSFSFNKAETSEYIALSFADFSATDKVTAAGSWTKGNAASYPANIRLWGSKTSYETLTGIFSANLVSLDEGEVQVDFDNPAKAERIRVSTSFKNNLATKANCETDPTDENCVFQEVKIYNPEDTDILGAPNGVHIRIMTDDKNNPTFYLIEGRYKYTEAKALGFAAFGLGGTREIYFQTIQAGGQIWGRFEFRDADDALLTVSGLAGVELAAVNNGVCKNTSDGTVSNCDEIDTAKYADLWKGRTGMDAMTESPVTTDFTTGKPTISELCLADFASCIDLSGK